MIITAIRTFIELFREDEFTVRIKKIINNNVVCAFDKDDVEVVLMGKGVGFRKSPGQAVNQADIEKVFRMENSKQLFELEELFRDTPGENIKATVDSIDYAKNTLKCRLNSNIYITLLDYINGVIDRIKRGIILENRLNTELAQFYPAEYQAGRYVVEQIRKLCGIEMPEGETGFIAMHFVNADLGGSMPETVDITRFIQEVLQIIKDDFGILIDHQSEQIIPFITHLKYLGKRLNKGNTWESNEEDIEFYQALYEKYKDAAGCAEKITAYVKIQYNTDLSEDEKMYLTIYIKRILMSILT